MFACYVQVLLAMLPSPRRDALLRRAFAFVEKMLTSSDAGVRDLAFIGLYEGESRWWFTRAYEYIGPQAVAALDRWRSDWRTAGRRIGRMTEIDALGRLMACGRSSRTNVARTVSQSMMFLAPHSAGEDVWMDADERA
jgi:hypothetical protein